MNYPERRQHWSYLFESFLRDYGLFLITLIVGLVRRDIDFLLENSFLIVLIVIFPFQRMVTFLTTRISVSGNMLILTYGFLRKGRREIPVSSITTINVTRRVSHRLSGACRLTIDNAGTAGNNDEVVVTLGKEAAEELIRVLKPGQDLPDGFNTEENTGLHDSAEDAAWGAGTSQAGVGYTGAVGSPQPGAGFRQGAGFAANAGSSQQGAGFAAYSGSSQQGAGFAANSGSGSVIFTYNAPQLFLMGLLRSRKDYIISAFASLGVIMGFLGSLFGESFEQMVDQQQISFIEYMAGLIASGKGGVVLVAFVLAFYILSDIIAGIGNIIKYYDFEVRDLGDQLRISYGMLTSKNYTVAKKKISALMYEQTLAMRLLHTGVMECRVMGYGTGSSDEIEDPLLFPLLKETEVDWAARVILPEKGELLSRFEPEKKSIRYFFVDFLFILAVLLTCAAGGFFAGGIRGFLIPALLLLLYALLNVLQKYRNACLERRADRIISAGGGFRKRTYLLKKTFLEGASESASIWKKRKGVTSVNVWCMAITGPVTARNLPAAAFDAVREELIY